MAVDFYRAVSFAELADFRQCGRLRPCGTSCEGKHMALAAADARRWGERLHGSGQFAVFCITVGDAAAAGFFRGTLLDGIGPACFATMEELTEAEVSEVTDEP